MLLGDYQLQYLNGPLTVIAESPGEDAEVHQLPEEQAEQESGAAPSGGWSAGGRGGGGSAGFRGAPQDSPQGALLLTSLICHTCLLLPA